MTTEGMKTHREMYPDQYTHELVGRRVQIRQTGEERIVERVVQSRFGQLCMFPGTTTAYALADVTPTNRWTWEIKGPGINERGQTTGVDPRDAVSRMFTSDRGMAIATRCEIGTDILHDAPGNAAATFETVYSGYTIRVTRDETLPAPGDIPTPDPAPSRPRPRA